MNDQEYEVQRGRLLALADRWVSAIGLGWWDIELAYARDDYEPTPNTKDTSIAQCKADWRYGHATITWNMPELPALSDEKLERCFVHELMHCFLSEARWRDGEDNDSLDHEERVATTLQKAFVWLRDGVLESPEKWRAPGAAVAVGEAPEGAGLVNPEPMA